MAIEARRKCGYRKVGGIYLVSEGLGAPCCKLPILLHICPTCNGGIKQTRGWQWIDPRPWLKGSCTTSDAYRPGVFSVCPLVERGPDSLGERVGLIWIGEQFYPTPSSFSIEAGAMGVSRRVQAIPRGFKLGETWVFVAHPKVRELHDVDQETGEPTVTWAGGVFRIFKPTRIEMLVTETQSRDEKFMDGLRKKDITPVIVPDDDKDHQGSVYDKDEDAQAELAL